ncbi:acyl-CoA dehydrogenase family protein [Quisquiliibacterium transsilvanicum]|uniref:Alkylation response protein AidB-like acyl-CoA dehydrogenase n=1 Tax=Quisquiliibacterium transsilvanicum TaxID=1549638 RepID=A0A7W8M953_9BURK|nr:acyl-CoA dehydrogenase family protein [Quisquiliibacterium transsilvanicum]MBB5271709.1 alkylation response protein AidB-like acyl-CoA dehydrogenase [Quisquiliibacterium transsilvanicum]
MVPDALPWSGARQFAEAGFFRTVVPRSLGGLECAPEVTMVTIETLAQADASAAWCVMVSATAGLSGAYLEPSAAREVYGDPLSITGGSNTPTGRAQAAGDGFRLSGRWPWVSHSANCLWLKGISVLLADGKPRLRDDGRPDVRMMVFPAAQATLIDTWQVAGLEGTGSGDMEVTDIAVPEGFTYSLVSDKPREDGPLYRFPAFGLLALGIGAVALGNARAAVDDLLELAGSKKPQGSRRTLAERGMSQSELAQAEAMLRSARAFYYEALGEAWQMANRGEEIGLEQRAALRLAATHATRTSADVVRRMYELGGDTVLFSSHPLQRRFRDAYAATQHMMIAPPSWELAGRVLMGLPTDAAML